MPLFRTKRALPSILTRRTIRITIRHARVDFRAVCARSYGESGGIFDGANRSDLRANVKVHQLERVERGLPRRGLLGQPLLVQLADRRPVGVHQGAPVGLGGEAVKLVEGARGLVFVVR